MKNLLTGIAHIGIPTNNLDTTIKFYSELGFETVYETVNKDANEKVAFFKLGNLMIETYENKCAKMETGSIDHIAIDVNNIEETYDYINSKELNTTNDKINFLPFWDNGVRFFTIEGPNKEKIEFSQML